MPRKGVINNPNGKRPIWDNPEALLKDFEAYLEEQAPHRIKVLASVPHIKAGHEYFDPPHEDDYDWIIEEIESQSEQKPITVRSFAVWKGVHRTTITTGYATGSFQQAYERILGECEAYAEDCLYNCKGSAVGIIFILKNCYGWSNKPTTKQLSGIDIPLSPEAQAALDMAMTR
jgi:hypothetical protein